MNRPTDRDRLLDDVLAEGTPGDFRAALLDKTLRLAKRRRRTRRARQSTVLALAIALCSFLLARIAPHFSGRGSRPEPGHVVVCTTALPETAIVRSRPFAEVLRNPEDSAVHLVRTDAQQNRLQRINDDELLAMLAPGSAALVRVGPHSQELVFVDPANDPRRSPH